jgi:curved DNA-binding protein CbpA
MLLSCVDGKTSIGDIIRRSPRTRGEPLKTIFALLEARFLVIKDKGKSPSGIRAGEIFEKNREGGDALINEIEKMYSGYENLDYYRVLGLDRHVTPDEIKKAYYRAAKKYHPDLHFGLPEDSKKKLLEIFTYITNAYLTLSHSQKREKYNDCVRQDSQGKAETAGRAYRFSPLEKDIEIKEYDGHLQPDDARFLRNSEIARLRFGEGKTKFRQKKFHEASRLFAMAIYFDGSMPEYHYFYGCSLAGLDNLKEAVKALNRANELMPLNADILAELGHVYMELGFPLRAKGYFDRAIRCDPSNARGTEGIEILGRRKDPH